ncbi:hypothetical protein C2W62_34315 [Candidatus Entotheonella serta]|nr:hypothetical protein C2W62_34315 [Candidatus Entotheonella serta]
MRIAIHTGSVVVGEMGSGGRYEQLALGETPNIAARLEGLAQPNTVVISEATHRLVQGYFVCNDLDVHTLKGASEPIQVYHVLQESGARNRLDTMILKGLTPLVGRDSDTTLMLERWEQVKTGMGQVVAISGDAGSGKSRLIYVLKTQLEDEPHTRFECQASPYYQNTALYPVAELFRNLLGFQSDESSEQKLVLVERAIGQSRLN